MNSIKKVLVVDDNPSIQEIVSELISRAGFTPLTASGGKEGLDIAITERPDLILLDINMPDMDGWTVLRKLKEGGITDSTKVMMLTATTEIGTDIFGLQDVVAGYIRKPFNNKELSERLRAALEEGPAERSLSPPRSRAACSHSSPRRDRPPSRGSKRFEDRRRSTSCGEASAIW